MDRGGKKPKKRSRLNDPPVDRSQLYHLQPLITKNDQAPCLVFLERSPKWLGRCYEAYFRGRGDVPVQQQQQAASSECLSFHIWARADTGPILLYLSEERANTHGGGELCPCARSIVFLYWRDAWIRGASIFVSLIVAIELGCSYMATEKGSLCLVRSAKMALRLRYLVLPSSTWPFTYVLGGIRSRLW
ncbi:hypothetical protein F4859DRAFT_133505 [Xylaria cf. heliscus]|nr:hypothetical protein F4859DRAFT_133505 [Xylaria cf. heliscus]